MSTPAPERENDLESPRAAEDESSWFDRLLQTFGLNDERDLRTLIESALLKSTSDALSPQERSMMLRILRFGTLTVEDVMVPRADIVSVDDSVSIEELLRVFRKSEHSRVPVYRETLDDPRGMIHIRDLMSWITEEANGNEDGRIDFGKVDLTRTVGSINIARELIYVPPSMSVLDLLLKMQTAQLHLALVVDEYGGTDGLVSIEDLVEEVVGDIADELGFSQPNTSQHLAILRSRNVVTTSRAGNTIYYALTSSKIIDAIDLLRCFMAEHMVDDGSHAGECRDTCVLTSL